MPFSLSLCLRGEEEFQVVATMGPASELPYVWPTTGFSGFEMDTAWKAFIVGMGKLVAVSFTVAGGLRGGYIFPLMCTGAAFGRVFHHLFPNVPLQLAVLCMAAGVNVAITRTSLATTLILGFLSGEPCALPAILSASLCSLFATAYLVRQTCVFHAPISPNSVCSYHLVHSLSCFSAIYQESNHKE
jgi:H+/Cl- antiporter ClcA